MGAEPRHPGVLTHQQTTMRNLSTTIPKRQHGDSECLTYGDLLRVVLEAPPQQGLTIAEIRRRLPLLDRIDATEPGDSFGFAARDLTALRELFDAHRWGVLHRDIAALGDAIDTAVEGDATAE